MFLLLKLYFTFQKCYQLRVYTCYYEGHLYTNIVKIVKAIPCKVLCEFRL